MEMEGVQRAEERVLDIDALPGASSLRTFKFVLFCASARCAVADHSTFGRSNLVPPGARLVAVDGRPTKSSACVTHMRVLCPLSRCSFFFQIWLWQACYRFYSGPTW